MNIKYDDLTKLFAIEQAKETSYRSTLRQSLDTKTELKYICNYINDIVKYFEKGLHSTAFSKMKNLFARTKNHKVLNNSMPYSTPCCRKFIV